MKVRVQKALLAFTIGVSLVFSWVSGVVVGYGQTPQLEFMKAVRIALSRDKLGELLLARGFITPQQLKLALRAQRARKVPLGQIFIEDHLISAGQLRGILWRQRTLRFLAAFLLCMMSLSGFGKKARADFIDDAPAKISVVSASNADILYQPITRFPNLFGAEEARSDDLEAFTKWSGMFAKFQDTMDAPESQKIIRELQRELSGYKSSSIFAMAEKVNDLMNAERYILDQNNWGKSDYWATPIEFLVRGGDCEDFAIAKYFALRALGVPESRLRLAIVHDEKKNIPHAILIVYAETGPIVLDNQNKEILSDSSVSHYRPIYSINREAWWLHTAPQETRLASAR